MSRQITLDPKISVLTPENVEIQYSLAGIGSRGLAVMADTLIQVTAVIALLSISVFLTYLFADLKRIFNLEAIESIPVWTWAILLIVIYLIRMGYFALFETFWSGQTPGKRLLKIRTVKDGGYPISFIEAMIRNILRIVDYLPGFYGVGLICIFFSPNEKRVGDYVAGTVVVKEKVQELPALEKSKLAPAGKKLIDFGPSLAKVTPQEYRVIKNFSQRRFELGPTSRLQLAMKIALPLVDRLEVPRPLNMSYEIFLIHLLHAYEENAKFI